MKPARWRERAGALVCEARVVWRILKHRRTPWHARLVAAGTVGYMASPVQLIPNYIPVIGPVDDVAVLTVGTWLLRRMVPDSIQAECRRPANPNGGTATSGWSRPPVGRAVAERRSPATDARWRSGRLRVAAIRSRKQELLPWPSHFKA
ncbi:MAG: YkvA family protein [Terriglobales bacterium]